MTDLLAERGERALYEESRTRAFGLAALGHVDDALELLTEGWTETWPQPAAYVADVARVRMLVRDYEDAIAALEFAVRGAEPAADVPDLLAACVLGAPHLRTRALRVAMAGGTLRQRSRAAFAVLRA